MSHAHSHGPGQPTHTHGPPGPGGPGTPQLTPQQLQALQAQMQAQMQQQQQAQMRGPDPVMQALIEESFVPVDIAIGQESTAALCEKHDLEKCAECNVDFSALNRLSKILQMNPNLRCPPPPQMVSQKLSQAITNMKDEGNTLFKTGQHEKAIQRYTMAANVAAQRAPWEAQQVMREELSFILSNRSAAYYEIGDYISAIVDADTVITLKRPWSKGYFRKARALLKLGRYTEAKEAIEAGMVFEPDNAEMTGLLATIESEQRASKHSKSNGAAKSSTPVAAAA